MSELSGEEIADRLYDWIVQRARERIGLAPDAEVTVGSARWFARAAVAAGEEAATLARAGGAPWMVEQAVLLGERISSGVLAQLDAAEHLATVDLDDL